MEEEMGFSGDVFPRNEGDVGLSHDRHGEEVARPSSF